MPYSRENDADLAYHFNARFDYMQEAYGETARDCNLLAEQDEAAELVEAMDEMEARGGPYFPWAPADCPF